MSQRTPARRAASPALQALLLAAIGLSGGLSGGLSAGMPWSAAVAGEADVVDVQVTALGDDRFRVDASVTHADEGWDHYADGWDVYDADGNLLGSRPLAHPHENEQPFTRSVTVTIPPTVERIEVRAKDSVHGEGGETFLADVPR